MRLIIEPGEISGGVTAPSSKSMTQRAYAAALLHHGQTTITGAGTADDELAALAVIRALGATVFSQTDSSIVIESSGIIPISDFIDCGESGLAARLFTPIAALANAAVHITGKGSLLTRPLSGLQEAMKSLGIVYSDKNGFLPLTIHGPLQSMSFHLDASFGSQLLSGLLFALSYQTKEQITIEVADLKSKPYIDMTLEVLKAAGRPIHHNNYTTFYINPKTFFDPGALTFDIEGDWSGAANLLVGGAIAGRVTVNNLKLNSLQADKAIFGVLQQCGTNLEVKNNNITAEQNKLNAFEFDATHAPDLFPILAVLAASCAGESVITGVHRLFHKESNRAESIAEMLQCFDVLFSFEDDDLVITGRKVFNHGHIETFKDHRMVMAAAIGALRAGGPVAITHPDSVNKSYPGFFTHLDALGIRHRSGIIS